ncbi:sialidase family protein [Emticicia sp. 21SJ11W-3]|uniref:sialidase family protein n=1 Tax=Emticicia sp. 21SJ11W-3 TaxID=2916755 RepID=UPI00209FEB1D|nr:sialidase family protein [Emticicia sp. 21SJ11W-3]UTA69919.1 glycoside hydrolase [Emticicia sp. 21SJ11W-3]
MKLRTNSFIFTLLFLFFYQSYAQSTAEPPGIVIDYMAKETGKYIGSPSICILPDGTYMASHDEFGPKSKEFASAQTRIFFSKDKGKTWQQIAIIDGQFWSNLFTHNGALYIMGTNKHHGNFIIRKSVDGGHSWTTPYSKTTGLLLEGEYHTAPVPVVIHKARIWRALEYATAPTTRWGKRYSAMMISAPLNSDLLNADNWRATNKLPYDSTYLNGKFNAWLEGNAVISRNGEMLDILRVDVPQGNAEVAAFVKIGRNGKMATFDKQTGFVPMPGASKKFSIRYDSNSDRYWALVNTVDTLYKNKTPASIRNQLALVSTKDLKKWEIHRQLLYHPDVSKHGFQYVDWQFENDDIIFVSRTAYDDAVGGANNFHDANFLTFHRIENFRKEIDKRLE